MCASLPIGARSARSTSVGCSKTPPAGHELHPFTPAEPGRRSPGPCYGQTRILTIAPDARYGSNEAFARAFNAPLAVPPSARRKSGDLSRMTLTEPLAMTQNSPTPLPAPRITSREAIHLIGLSIECQGGDISGIPGLWQAFSARAKDIGSDGPVYGVSYDVEGPGQFRYLAGMEGTTAPAGMVTLEIPPARYAVFTHQGHIDDLPGTISAIWEHGLEAHGLTPAAAPELEVYDARFDAATGRGAVEIWIPLDQGA